MDVRGNIIDDIGKKVDWLLAFSRLPHPKICVQINNHHVTDFMHLLFEHIGPKVGLGMVYSTIVDAYHDFWAATGIRIQVEVAPMLEQSGGYIRIPSNEHAEYFIEPRVPCKDSR